MTLYVIIGLVWLPAEMKRKSVMCFYEGALKTLSPLHANLTGCCQGGQCTSPIQLLEYQILWERGLINKLTPPAAAAQPVYYCGNRNGHRWSPWSHLQIIDKNTNESCRPLPAIEKVAMVVETVIVAMEMVIVVMV